MRIAIYNENVHEKTDERVSSVYPEGIHGALSSFLASEENTVKCFTLDNVNEITEEELAADKAEKEDRELARKQAAAEAERKKICDGMDEAFDGTLNSIRKYMNRNDYWESYLRYAAHHARDILDSVLDHTRTLSRKEYRSMLHILGNMVAYDDLPVEMVLAAVQGVSIDGGQEKKGEDE